MKKYIQVLSVISCLAVVFLHANSVFWIFSYERYWVSANIIESVCYFAVPVFFMISGCNLINYRKKYSTGVYFKKRIMKTLIPFLIWSVIACVYVVYTGGINIQDLNFWTFIDCVINTNFFGVYWFFIPLFSCYLCIPALAMISEENRKEIFKYLLTAAFIVNILLPFIFFFLPLNFNGNFSVSMVTGYLFFVLAGYYIDNYPIEKKYRIIVYLLAILGLALHIGGTWYLSWRDGSINQIFKGYVNVPCVLYSLGIFMFFKYSDGKRAMDILAKGAERVSDTTFGVYLIHWFLLDALLRITGINSTSIIYRIGGGIGVFVIAVLIVKIVKRIPVLRKIVP